MKFDAQSDTITTASLQFSPTTNGIIGTTTNDNASSGYVGEFISSVISSGSAVTFPHTTITDLTSISLTAGDWDVWGNIQYLSLGTTPSQIFAWINNTSASVPDNSLFISNGISTETSAGLIPPTQRFSLSSTTTIYLTGEIANASGNGSACGGIYARRVR